jgi:glutamine synthetase
MTRELVQRLDELRSRGVDTVRINYGDMHGIARGKDLPLDHFADALEDGLGFCSANLADGLSHSLTQLGDRIAGGPVDRAFPDMRVRPMPATLAQLPWDPSTAWCLATIDPDDPRSASSPRSVLERAAAELRALGLTAVCAAELEFYLLKSERPEGGSRPREAAPMPGLSRYTNQFSMIYTVGERADPQSVVREMVRSGRQVGLGVTAIHHECGRGQFEINLNHGEALDAGDRAFRFKYMVKELAARHGLIATFMGKPFADDAGSGLHVHVSLTNDRGNAFHDPESADGLSVTAKHFLAGVLAHAPALAAFGSPTINSYKRIVPGTLVPTLANWGCDDRNTYARVPPDRGKGTRLELRAADAAANAYLVIAANLFAGLDGIRRTLTPPPPLRRDAALTGAPLPMRLEDSIRALKDDEVLTCAMGAPLVDAFCALKSAEAEQFRRAVTDWELNEYAWHL